LCAAPGGKTAQLAARGALVTAVEADPQRAARLRKNLARLRLDAEIIVADARTLDPERFGRFRAILLDAPCSATGTLRRRPDIAWHKRAYDVLRLVALQTELLTTAARLLEVGGTLVYAVCSLQPEEGAPVVDAVLRADPGLVRAPLSPAEAAALPARLTADGDLRTLPCDLAEQGGMDGFFIARLQRRPIPATAKRTP
jgi:16S rRNA (cytosine967-C5)-methyltransferase